MTTKERQFWLSNDAGSKSFQFPVLPEKIQVTSDAQNESVMVSGVGEVTIIQDPSAKTFEWSCHFPAMPHQGSISSVLAPMKYVNMIENWKKSKKPVKFVATNVKTTTGRGGKVKSTSKRSLINLYCTIEAFSYYERGGDPNTIYYTIKLKEYRAVSVRKLKKVPTLRATDGGSDSKNGKVKTKGSRLKLYASASRSSEVVARMPNGSKLKVYEQTGNWYKVKYIKKNKKGYAQSKYVKITK